jgi:hypothetical protein
MYRSRDSFVCIATDYRLEVRGSILGKDKRFSLLQTVHIGSAPLHPPVHWAPGCLSSGAKRPGREANQSPTSGSEVKNGGGIPPLPHMPSWYSAELHN